MSRNPISVRSLSLLTAALLWTACGGDDGPSPTADGGEDGGMDSGTAGDGSRPSRCGNLMEEEGEDCDDGNTDADDGCSPECTLECGDGRVGGDELCDTAVAEGSDGACPIACDDGDSCTTDALDGSDCSRRCSHAPITAATDGDGCCPDGVDATDDSDCSAVCGNGVLESGEACDTAIAEGSSGACPTSCDDGMDCTADSVANAGTCDAVCELTAITAPADGDSCCPPGETIGTDSDCAAMCGDGVVTASAGETCDTAITSGTGSCPTACDDGMACTTDSLANGGTCTATCTTTVVTAPADGDGCCPSGATMATDSDCTGTCGDGVVSGGETCDTAIASGSAGACPTSCSDGVACTMDVLTGAGTCSATCSHPAITTAADGDGCCPSGETIATDSDCPAACGDGVVTSPETCDTGISSGTGSCPTACDDGDPCTTDTLANSGTCRAQCTTTALAAGPMDSCCPTGADLSTDPDCTASCGDGVVTGPEACDDGNTTSGDGCSASCGIEPVAFWVDDLQLKDPHLFAQIIWCMDVTGNVNTQIGDSISMDDDGDGYLELSIIETFSPLAQADGSTTPSELVFPECSAPAPPAMCTLPAGATRTSGTAMNMGGGATCLDVIAGTVRPYSPAVITPQAPAAGTCYVVPAGTVTFDLSGIPITLQDAYIAGEWFGNPASEINDGLVRGFISEADADATIIPEGTTGFPSIDGEPLSSLLRGGTGNCASGSDMDSYMDTPGWYFYLNFTAERVAYGEM